MAAFMVAYIVVLLGVVLFVFRMGIRQAQLQKSLEESHAKLRGLEPAHHPDEGASERPDSAASRAA